MKKKGGWIEREERNIKILEFKQNQVDPTIYRNRLLDKLSKYQGGIENKISINQEVLKAKNFDVSRQVSSKQSSKILLDV